MLKIIGVLFFSLYFCQVSLAAQDVFDDDTDETDLRPYRGQAGKKWQELDVALPAYPRSEDLVAADVTGLNYPFSVFIDPGSISVGDDRIIRYTVVLRSDSGAETVSYEGLQCSQRQYKRYAYGSNNQFKPALASEWAFIRNTRQDLYRKVLADSYFCPLPGGNNVAVIRRRLKQQGGDNQRWDYDE